MGQTLISCEVSLCDSNVTRKENEIMKMTHSFEQLFTELERSLGFN